jgi:hypothetical protein
LFCDGAGGSSQIYATFSAPNFCKYFFGAIEEYQRIAGEKIWKSRFLNYHIKPAELRHDEAPGDETVHPWLQAPAHGSLLDADAKHSSGPSLTMTPAGSLRDRRSGSVAA